MGLIAATTVLAVLLIACVIVSITVTLIKVKVQAGMSGKANSRRVEKTIPNYDEIPFDTNKNIAYGPHL